MFFFLDNKVKILLTNLKLENCVDYLETFSARTRSGISTLFITDTLLYFVIIIYFIFFLSCFPITNKKNLCCFGGVQFQLLWISGNTGACNSLFLIVFSFHCFLIKTIDTWLILLFYCFVSCWFLYTWFLIVK